MISALRFFRATIYGNHTTIYSDHKPLTFLLRHGKTHDNLARWVVELQSYDISIEYHKGSSNVLADHLSRNANATEAFTDNSPETDDIVEFPRCLVQRRPRASAPANHNSFQSFIGIKPYDVLIEQKQDSLCRNIMHFLETGSFSDAVSEDEKSHYMKLAEHCIIRKNGCLYHLRSNHPSRPRYAAIFIPDKLREPICIALHTSPTAGGHFNWKKTLAKIERRYYWPTIKEDVFKYVRSCEACQRKRPHLFNREYLLPVQTTAVFSRVYLDLSGPYHQSARSNKYILCLIDHFTKYVITAAIPDCTATTVAHHITTECILKYGAMNELVSDNASYLKGELLSEIGRLLHIDRYFTTPYHHEGNGACERVFATFQEMLRTYISANQLDWDLFLPACTFSYNTSIHTSTNESPFFLMFGRDPILNIDLLLRHSLQNHVPSDSDASIYKESLVATLHSTWSAAVAYNSKRSAIMKRHYDKSHLRPASIQVGDRVFLRDFSPKPGLSQKLCYPWLGQFRVIAIDPPHLTIVSITSPQTPPKRVHMNQVKKCFTLSGPVFTTPWLPVAEEQALAAACAVTTAHIGYSNAVVPPQSVFSNNSQLPHRYNTRFRSRQATL
ncbi:integrase core domain protein [Oesophagostomum dentatum]|uniref:RNA-directed DNA polymerase n=1 Tax=Oesophagostomum dentatum TaxID=61180 RepID=A0A0B1SIK2_OESDE|nr:integrase core domain protein [Oesophagostomum dentatum]